MEITGSPMVEKVKIRDLNTKNEQTINVKGVFISGEKTPVTQMLVAAGVKTDTLGCIVIDEQMQTNVPRVYAAGDATCGRKYQIAVSVGQAVTAALNMIRRRSEAAKPKR
jgi:thioredoxin reductase